MAKRQILVIEDDAAIRQGIVDALAFAGFGIVECDHGERGLETALRCDYDLLLLDLVLPGRDGLAILEELRGARPTVPVIILTARGEEHDRVRGLSLGADDYVVKPFSVKELLARVEAVLRRSPERPGDVDAVEIPGGRIDLVRREVFIDGNKPAPLSEREAELVRYLAARAGKTVTREEILTRVWRIDTTGIETRTVDMHVARLREKLRDNAAEPAVIRTVRGKGYLFDGNGHAS